MRRQSFGGARVFPLDEGASLGPSGCPMSHGERVSVARCGVASEQMLSVADEKHDGVFQMTLVQGLYPIHYMCCKIAEAAVVLFDGLALMFVLLDSSCCRPIIGGIRHAVSSVHYQHFSGSHDAHRFDA
jgi:hypothetical protein